ncbi:uncharacterized protein isoform X2 [Danio rerio]|uniref:Uncharacterized protein isoform X2 n=1 Tax=Danio rerio TaxID=7955 RepID=A0AC58IRW1_DANRE
MFLTQFTNFTVVLLFVAEGSSVKIHNGGNTTLPCSIKADREINWIITDGNQTFIRIMKLEYTDGEQSRPEPTNIHPSYFGRIRSVSSSTNTHSLLLLNITEDDLLLFCCTECRLEQTHCTKLDSAVLISVYLPVVGVLLLLLLLSSVCVCWRAAEMQKGCGITCGRCHEEWTLDSVQGVKSLNDWTLAEVLYAPIQSNKSS